MMKSTNSTYQGPLMAAAIQEHLTRNAIKQTTRKKSKYPLSQKQRQLQRWRKEQERNAIPMKRNGMLDPIQKPDRIIDIGHSSLTLAQKLGAVPRPRSPLSLTNWQSIKNSCIKRDDFSQGCPICKECFSNEPQVILTCSHLFHQTCIASYERFLNQKQCPLCRQEYREKLQTHYGLGVHRIKNATRIQSIWRGYVARKSYQEYQKHHAPSDPRLLFKYHMKRVSQSTLKLEQHMIQESLQIGSFIKDINAKVQASRDLMSQLHDTAWDDILAIAMKRDPETCAICLTLLNLSSKKRAIALLNCTHLFHQACISSFEAVATKSCPICRSHYTRVTL